MLLVRHSAAWRHMRPERANSPSAGVEQWLILEEIPLPYSSQAEAPAKLVQQSESKPEVQCPGCGSHFPRRLERKGFFEKKVFPLFGYYPWTCGACRANFFMRKRYRTKWTRMERAR
jgi:hypothetical protein